MDKKLVDKDEEINELSSLVTKLQQKLKQIRVAGNKAGDDLQNAK